MATSGPASTMISLTEIPHVPRVAGQIAGSGQATDEMLDEIVGAQVLSVAWTEEICFQELAHDRRFRRAPRTRGRGQARVQLRRQLTRDCRHFGHGLAICSRSQYQRARVFVTIRRRIVKNTRARWYCDL